MPILCQIFQLASLDCWLPPHGLRKPRIKEVGNSPIQLKSLNVYNNVLSCGFFILIVFHFETISNFYQPIFLTSFKIKYSLPDSSMSMKMRY